MKTWPVPDSFLKKVPDYGYSGSFWENRGDRYHCGVDIYSPEKSKVVAIEDGKVIEVGNFTSPKKVPYWNTTYYVLIKHKTGLLSKYAELNDVKVAIGQSVKSGQIIGSVGAVLNLNEINDKSPLYIQKLKTSGISSMLHFELYNSYPEETSHYLGGNMFIDEKPGNIVDPTGYFKLIFLLNI